MEKFTHNENLSMSASLINRLELDKFELFLERILKSLNQEQKKSEIFNEAELG